MAWRGALLLSLLWWIGAARATHAQVNAEVLGPNPAAEGWGGGVDGSLALLRGNIDLFEVGGAGRLQHQTLHPALPTDEVRFVAQRVVLLGSARFAERAGAPFVNQAFVHARWTRMWHRWIGTDVFAQYQLNQFLRLQGRAIAGAGIRVELVRRRRVMAWGGSGYLFEYDRIRVLPGAPDTPVTYEHRFTNYLTLRLALFASRLLVQNTLYYQPRFDRPSDYRILDELEVLAKVGEPFGLGVTLGVLHDSAPPTGVVKTDLRLTSSVRVTF